MNATINEEKTPIMWPVTCPWCEREGKRTVVDYSTVPHSSGICPRHNRETRREAGLDDD